MLCFSCLISLDRTLNLVMNNTGDSGILVRYLTLMNIHLNLHDYRWCLLLVFNKYLCQIKEVLFISFAKLSWFGMELCQMVFLQCLLSWSYVFSSCSDHVAHYMNTFPDQEHSYISRIKCSWSWYNFNTLLNLIWDYVK